jgi:hypothetical protein
VALALDSTGTGTGNPGETNWSYTHTTVGTIDAVLIFVGYGSASDSVSAVSFGGVALTTLVYRAASSAGDSPACKMAFGSTGFSGLTPGSQTVSITESDNAAKYAMSFALVSGNGCEIVETQNVDNGFVANPSVAFNTPAGRDAFVAGSLQSGQNVVSGCTPFTGQQLVHNRDYGTISGQGSRLTALHTGGALTYGWTIASFSATILATAIAEIESQVVIPPQTLAPFIQVSTTA